MDFRKELDKRTEYAEKVVDKYIPRDTGLASHVADAMEYSVTAGGKRLRPIMMQEAYRMYGGCDTDTIEPFMAAIEFIHNYSLVHDDLPAMDNDLYRRGKKTTHAVYGAGIATLAGDGLLNLAFETAMKAFSPDPDPVKREISGGSSCSEKEISGEPSCSEKEKEVLGKTGAGSGSCNETDTVPETGLSDLAKYRRVALALQILGNRAGIMGMVGGQSADMDADGLSTKAGFSDEMKLEEKGMTMTEAVTRSGESPDVEQEELDEKKDLNQIHSGISDEDRILFIYHNKTSALLEASMMVGAALAGASGEEIRKIQEVARNLGVAFQIQDDILDVEGDEDILGKPIGSDAENEKFNVVSVFGLARAKEESQAYSERTLELLKGLSAESPFLSELVLYLLNRKK
ncbi:MAG: polyprenyl synthetase family protein [Lachnospiraceae bacterium]|nr:polyprenyl synthetase family protein [Lachnospiraceae bacterium]